MYISWTSATVFIRLRQLSRDSASLQYIVIILRVTSINVIVDAVLWIKIRIRIDLAQLDPVSALGGKNDPKYRKTNFMFCHGL